MLKQLLRNIKKPYTLIAFSTFLLLLVSLIPLLIIGKYAHPCADDFSYGYYTHAFWSTTHSLSQTLHWAFYQVKATYDTWQGTFSSVFLMALSPAIWGEQYYFLTPIIMLSMIVFPHFYLLYRLLVRLLNVPKSIWITVSSVISFVTIQTMHAPVEGLFWYNGAVHYVFMHGCMLLLIGTLIPNGHTTKKQINITRWFFACLFAFICGGSNYPTALVGILVTLAVAFLYILFKRKPFGPALVLIVYGISFYKNITAYGNQIRQTSFVKSSPIEAILDSFMELFHFAKGWMSLQIILFMLLLIPIFWKLADTPKYKFPIPGIVTLFSLCSVACMFTPGLYAMGTPGAGRTINIIKMWFLFLVFLNECYWIGYLKNRLLSTKLPIKPEIRIYSAGIFMLILIAFVAVPERKLLDYSSYAAYVSLRTGEAEKFHYEYLNRLEILNSDSTSVALPEFTTKPRLLYFDDIQTNPYDWRNIAVARWYGKEQVVLNQP